MFAPSEYFARVAPDVVPPYLQGYNVADYLLEVASDPHVSLFQLHSANDSEHDHQRQNSSNVTEKGLGGHAAGGSESTLEKRRSSVPRKRTKYATTFLTQLQFLSGREWKILQRCDAYLQSANLLSYIMLLLGIRRCSSPMLLYPLSLEFSVVCACRSEHF